MGGGDHIGESPAAAGSVLEQIREARRKKLAALRQDFLVPRWSDGGGPQVYVTYRPIEQDWIDEANEAVENLEKSARVTSRAMILAKACVRVFAIAADGEELTLSEHFDQQLAEALGIDGEVTGGVDVARKLYFGVDGDLLNAFEDVFDWSGFNRRRTERELQGN